MVSSKKKKKIIWVGIQHVRDYRAQGETAVMSILLTVLITLQNVLLNWSKDDLGLLYIVTKQNLGRLLSWII